MKSTIKIVSGKRGWHLKINSLFISWNFDSTQNPIKGVISDSGIPYGATEWVSIQAIKDFWHKYMPLIIAATYRPYNSVWGQLIPVLNEPIGPEIGHAEYLESSNQMKSFDVQ